MMMIILMIVKGREHYSLQVSNTFLKITTPNQNQGPKKVLSGQPHKWNLLLGKKLFILICLKVKGPRQVARHLNC